MTFDKKAYMQSYRLVHRDEIRDYMREYRSMHKEDKKLDDRRHYLKYREQIIARIRAHDLKLGQQFMDGVYGHLCFFCKKEVGIEDLVRHHINGDGNEEREELGGGTTGRQRSWRRAVAEQDSTKWATAHRSCHADFHDNLKVRD